MGSVYQWVTSLLMDPTCQYMQVFSFGLVIFLSESYKPFCLHAGGNEQGSHHLLNAHIYNVTHRPSVLPMLWAQNLSGSLFLESKTSVFCWGGRDFWGSKCILCRFSIYPLVFIAHLYSHSHIIGCLNSWGFLWISLASSRCWWCVTFLSSVSSITSYPPAF